MLKKFPPWCKRDVVAAAQRGGLTVAQVGADFNVTTESLRRGKRRLEVENEILRRN